MNDGNFRMSMTSPSLPAGLQQIDWNCLEYFRVAGRLQHVTRAAEQLGMSQPALSRALARLEADLGVPLFQRAGRSVRLTRYGVAFLQRVERALREIDEGRIELADLAGLKRGTVAIGFLRTLGAKYVPQIVRRFSAEHPGVKFSFTPNNSAALEEQLLRGDLDVIFTTAPAGDSRFVYRRVANQELALIVAHSHPLARRRRVALHEVAAEPFVTFKHGHAFRRLTEDLCAAAGFVPTISFEGDDSSSLPGFVAAGFGVAIVPLESSAVKDVVSLRITAPEARRSIGIGWLEERYLPASVRAFRDFVIASAAPSRR
jgi:DNA-binding transcriptional LysR family regulator